MSVGTSITYTLPVEGGPTVTTCGDRDIVVTEVEWRTYVYEGEAVRSVTAFHADADNRSWNLSYERVPEWVPRPPAAWFALADEIAAQAVTP